MSRQKLDGIAVQGVLAAVERLKQSGMFSPVMTMDTLTGALPDDQKQLVEQVLELDPQDYGVATPYVGLETAPDDLVLVSGQRYVRDGTETTIEDRYLPKHVHAAFLDMNYAFEEDNPGRSLLIGAGYRSPAYQVVVFVWWLVTKYDGDIGKTIRHASPPAYSQHAIASQTAIDIMTIDGRPSDDNPEDFKGTLEYSWLQQHASAFDFYESWPENNGYGMRPESWHWQYISQLPGTT